MTTHSAADAALGFRYQELYALLALWRETDDDAIVFLETLDDVVLVVDGQTLLEQLKHSLAEKPSPISIKSVSLWKTLKAWIDVLPDLILSQTRFNLVSVADISSGSPLEVLLQDDLDRASLLANLELEALRVRDERAYAKTKGNTNLPHSDRAAGCEAFLKLDKDIRTKFINRIRLKPKQDKITKIEETLAKYQTSVPTKHRAKVAQRLIEWWDRQVLYSMCNKREKAISRFEVLQRHMEIVSDLELDKLTSPFDILKPPSSHEPDTMIEQQVTLVDGTKSELNRAIRQEWRARETRSFWSNENPARHDLIAKYDDRLIEEWSDRHTDIQESCDGCPEGKHKEMGHELLKWSHYQAHKDLEPITPEFVAPFYVRGSYQVLSISGNIGWHPNYRVLLGFDE